LADIGRTGALHEIHGGVHLVGGGSLLTHLPILAQTILGRPRVALGRVQGVQGLPQVTGNPHCTNALGAIKVLARELNEGVSGGDRRGSAGRNPVDWIKKMF
ncbi:MAG TPA: hypothetical protein VFT46_08510, partial [Holophagaceae bacterium]|nr:hypothetical protein [Holophagaceae bacterium]